MAYMSQERKTQIAPKVKEILKKYGVKGSLSVQNHSGLCLTLKSGKIDFVKECLQEEFFYQVNTYYTDNHYEGTAREFFREVLTAMNAGNWDNSEPQYDYFDKGWYVYINVGKWNKPYKVTVK